MNRLALAFAVAAFALPAAAQAAPCRDTHGHFVKCTQATPAKAPTRAAMATRAAAKPAASAHKTAAAGAARCRNAKGQFAKCGTAGARPI